MGRKRASNELSEPPQKPAGSSYSVYSVLATYLSNAVQCEQTVRGYIDGENNFNSFMTEFNAVCETKFTTRTSWRKSASNLPRRVRYGKEERIYWEYNSGNLRVPFTGLPFVVRSCITKHCQFGSHYYKGTQTRKDEKQHYLSFEDDPTAPTVAGSKRRRKKKPTKKCECPAIVHIREVVMFPEFAIPQVLENASKTSIRHEKAQQIVELKKQLYENAQVNVFHRYYVSVPLPDTHKGYHEVSGHRSNLHPQVVTKLDQLLSQFLNNASQIRQMVHEYVATHLQISDDERKDYVVYPTEQDIVDYMYMRSIMTSPKPSLEVKPPKRVVTIVPSSVVPPCGKKVVPVVGKPLKLLPAMDNYELVLKDMGMGVGGRGNVKQLFKLVHSYNPQDTSIMQQRHHLLQQTQQQQPASFVIKDVNKITTATKNKSLGPPPFTRKQLIPAVAKEEDQLTLSNQQPASFANAPPPFGGKNLIPVVKEDQPALSDQQRPFLSTHPSMSRENLIPVGKGQQQRPFVNPSNLIPVVKEQSSEEDASFAQHWLHNDVTTPLQEWLPSPANDSNVVTVRIDNIQFVAR